MFSPLISGTKLYDYVELLRPIPGWAPLENGPLARLHQLFWGKRMDEEELDWLKAQPPAKGDEVGDENQADEYMDMGDKDGDDILPGCYPLDIGIVGFPYRKIWIRADYIRVYEYIDSYYKEPPFNNLAPSAVITGQSGIGKSAWVFYAIRRRLGEMRPFMWYYQEDCYLFVEEGVYQMPHRFQGSMSFKTFLWTFVDSDMAQDGIPTYLVPNSTRLFAIYSTSPYQKRWFRLHKTTRDIVVLMNPWKRGEIHRAASALQLKIDADEINRVFDHLGPTPLFCFEYLLDQTRLIRYEKILGKMISQVTLAELEKLFKDPMSDSDLSYMISLISRKKKSDLPGSILVSPITPVVQSRLANRFRDLQRDEQLRLFSSFAKFPRSRAVAGIFFEATAQRDFQDRISLALVPMAWQYSSEALINNPGLEASRQRVLAQDVIRVNIFPSRVEEFPNQGPEDIQSNVLYIPEATNHETLDSFIWSRGILYIFHFNIAVSHRVKQDLCRFFGQYPSPFATIENWRFIFVTPPNVILRRPQFLSPKLSQLSVYCTVYDLTTESTRRKAMQLSWVGWLLYPLIIAAIVIINNFWAFTSPQPVTTVAKRKAEVHEVS